MGNQDIRTLIADAIRTLGVATTSKLIQLSPETVLRIGGGFSVHRATMVLAERNLPRLKSGTAA